MPADPHPPAADSAPRSRWYAPCSLLRQAGTLGFLVLVGGSLLVWSARWFWLGEVAASFSWHLGWAGGAGALLLASIQRPRLALAAALLAGVHLWPELSLWLPDERSGALEEPRPELTVASCNLLWTNTYREGLLEWLERADPDVVAFQEVSPLWREVLEGLSESHPYLLLSPPPEEWNRGTWGTAFLARVPITGERLIPPPEGLSRPLMEITTLLDGQPLILRGAHPVRPGRAWRNAGRDAVLQTLARQDWSGAGILLGDLNVTSTSPSFARLLETSGLRDSRVGFGRQPSYTTQALVPGLEIAIDHVLVSDSIHVLERRTGVLWGSDHRTVVVRVARR